MVSVANSAAAALRDEGWQAWLQAIGQDRAAEDVSLIRRACQYVEPLYAGLSAVTGETLFQHAMGTAGLCASLRLDADSIAAALLYAVPQAEGPQAMPQLQEAFEPAVVRLVDGVARMTQIEELNDSRAAGGSPKDRAQQAESLRKMLLAMVEDIRVVLIKLAERTHTMRAIKDLPEDERRPIAQEVLDIYAPLANRLGVWHIKWELEDFAFRYLEPQTYKRIAKLLDEKRLEREQYIGDVIARLKDELAKVGVKAEVSGRPKHIYSIYRKMRRKNVDFDEIYDVRAVRLLVEEVGDCYTALGIVHNLWQPIPKEFDDYISHPKGNFYRSLHTAVIGPEGKALEVQIRTFDMHKHAELGVAAHWRYKEGGRGDAKYEEKIAWLRQILEWKEDVSDAGELMDQFKSELFQDVVYVLTPQGRVIDLPAGSTPIDFAYHVHTSLGDRCRGAKVDGAMVPLNFKLATGQRVEILSAKQGGPSRDWLNPALGYVKSARAKAKIRHWFKYQNFEGNVSQGREILDREMHRMGLTAVNQEKLAQKFNFPRLEEFLAALGRGDLAVRQLDAALQEDVPKETTEWQLPAPRQGLAGKAETGILIHGAGGLLTSIAKCCKPVPPEPIVGYVTRGRGVSIHRPDCSNIQHLPEEGQDRVVAAQWGGGAGAVYAVEVDVDARDRQGLLRDISEVLSREKVNVTAVNSETRHANAHMRFTIEVRDLDQLSRMLTLIREVPGVVAAQRKL